MTYKGKPSYASLARRNGELSILPPINRQYMQWIINRIEELNPNDHLHIPSHITPQLNENSIRCHLSQANRLLINSHFKFHKSPVTNTPTNTPTTSSTTSDWWIWHCPESAPLPKGSSQPSFLNRSIDHRNLEMPNPVHGRTKRQHIGSVRATLPAILERSNITEDQFNRLPWDSQLKIRIEQGVAIRNEHKKRLQLLRQFRH